MKKILAHIIVLATLLSLISSMAFAADKTESLNVATLKDEELLLYYFQIQAELALRGYTASKQIELEEGNYKVGTDLPAGYYSIICISTLDDETSTSIDALDTMYSSFGLGILGDAIQGMSTAVDMVGDMTVDILSSSGEKLNTFELGRGKTAKVALEDSQIIQVSAGAISLNPIN